MAWARIASLLARFVTAVRERGLLVAAFATGRVGAEGVIAVARLARRRVIMLGDAVAFASRYDRPMGSCLWLAATGWDAESYFLWGLDTRSAEMHLSRGFARYAIREHDGPIQHVTKGSRHVLHDKIATQAVFAEIADAFPPLVGYVHDGRFYPSDDAVETIEDAVLAHERVVIKPADNTAGTGVHFLAYRDDRFWMDDSPMSSVAIDRLVSEEVYRNALVTEVIEQHRYAADIAPRTTNTIRLLTVQSRTTGQPRIARAVHRFGTRASFPVDTYGKGGVLSPIDPATGTLGPIVTLDASGRRIRRDTHPETDVTVTGRTVPMWDAVRQIVTTGAACYRSARIIGWDIVIGEDRPYVLEASGQPGITGPQLEAGLLADPDLAYHINRA